MIGPDLRQALHKAIEEIYTYPLRQTAIDTLNRQLRSGIADDKLAELVVELRAKAGCASSTKKNENKNPRSFARWGSRHRGDAHVPIYFDEYGKKRSGQGRCPESVRTGPFWSLQ